MLGEFTPWHSNGKVHCVVAQVGDPVDNPKVGPMLVEKVIQGRDFTCVTEGMNAIEAWLGSLPGHVYGNVRQPPISTLNLAHMMPLSAVWAGLEHDAHSTRRRCFTPRPKARPRSGFRFMSVTSDTASSSVRPGRANRSCWQ